MKRNTWMTILIWAICTVFLTLPATVSAYTLSLETTDASGSPKSAFMANEELRVVINIDDPTAVAGAAFTLIYDPGVVIPPTTTDGVADPAEDVSGSAFPFTFVKDSVTTPTHRENTDALTGQLYLSGAAINETTGGPKPVVATATALFTIKFTVKPGVAVGTPFEFELVQTELMNEAAGYGNDVDDDGVFDAEDTKDKVPVLVGALDNGHADWLDLTKAFPVLLSHDTVPVFAPLAAGCSVTDGPKWNVSGTVTYAGNQTGTIYVGVFNSATPSFATLVKSVDIAAPGAFTIVDVPEGTGFYLAAFRDSDGGINLAGSDLDLDTAEAQGQAASTFDVTAAVTGKTVTLNDPDGDSDGMPDYWVALYAGIGPAGDDADADGYSNLVEFQNGTMPTTQDDPFGTDYNAETDNRTADYQVVKLNPQVLSTTPSSSFTLSVDYDVSDGNNATNGIWITVHYNSNKLTYTGFNDSEDNSTWIGIGGIQTQPIDSADTGDNDQDALTDRMITMQAMSTAFPADWPGIDLPAVLAKLNFTVDEATSGATDINIIRVQGDASYEFAGLGATVNIIDWNFDIDGSGAVTPFTDGLLFIRYLLGYSQFYPEVWIQGVVDPINATRTTAAEIEAYIETGVSGLMADIDNSGGVLPFTDGLLLIRYLLGYPQFYPGIWIQGVTDPINATRTTAEGIEGYLSPLVPVP